jgi:hypothetical protein
MWNVIKSCTIGTSHIRANIPCQDYCDFKKIKINGKEGIVICIADGAGSAAQASLGAQLTVARTLGQINTEYGDWSVFEKQWVEAIIKISIEHLNAVAIEQNLQLKDFACTFLFAIFTGDYGIFAQIGDGCWVIGDNSNLLAPTWPFVGEFANETIFVTSTNYLESLQYQIINQKIDFVAGFTDGLQNLLLDFSNQKPFAGFFLPFIDTVIASSDSYMLSGQLTDFLSSERVCSKTDDDKTLILAWRAG